MKLRGGELAREVKQRGPIGDKEEI
jgi:hypothetical protein